MTDRVKLLWGLLVLGALVVVAFISLTLLGLVVQATGYTVTTTPPPSTSSQPPSPSPSSGTGTSPKPDLKVAYR